MPKLVKKDSSSKRTSSRVRSATAATQKTGSEEVNKPTAKTRRGRKARKVPLAATSVVKKRLTKKPKCQNKANVESAPAGEKQTAVTQSQTQTDKDEAESETADMSEDKRQENDDTIITNNRMTGTDKSSKERQDANQGFVQVNSKHLTEDSLQTLTRLDTIQAMLPTISNPLENEITFYTESQTLSNTFSKTVIPSYSVLQLWKEQLQQHTTNDPPSNNGHFYIEVRDCRYNVATIDQMLMLHKAKDIRCAVEKELEWFAGRLIMPKSVLKHPSSESLKRFQNLVFRHKWDEELDGYGMNGEELAKVCGNRWMSDGIIQWVLDVLNSSQQDTFCIYKRPSHQGTFDEKYVREHFGNDKELPSSLFFIFNVGCSKDGVFFGSDKSPGCHFSFCHVTRLAEDVKIIYGDSLGWPAPSNLKEIITAYFTVIYNCQLTNFDITMCHDPQQSVSNYEHCCSNQKTTCAQNFPLQTCGSICGMVTLMMAAFACQKRTFFDLLTTVHSSSNLLPSLNVQHLKDPSSNAKYLRRVLATWFSDREICVDYLIPRRFEGDGTDEESGAESEQEVVRELEAVQMNGKLENGAANEANESCQNKSNVETADLNTGISNNVQCDDTSVSNNSEHNKEDGAETEPTKLLENSILNPQVADEQTIPSESSPTESASSGNHGCPKCDYTTKLIFNMKRHIKRHHPDITFTPPLAHSCPSCSYSSNKSYDVYKHISRCHPGVQWTAQMQRRGPKAKEGPKRHKCPQCPYQSNSKHNINRHQQSCHETMQTLESSRMGKCQCLECGQRLYKISDLRRHLSTKHAFIFKTETVTLESYQAFAEWKASIEIAEGCSFTKTTGDKVIQGTKRTQYFQCNRSGTFRSNNKGKRRQKWQGSCKIESNCTSTMVASILESGQVEVECVCTHYSHQIELQHVWIPKGRKRENTNRGNQGQSREQVIKDIRDSVSNVYGRHHVLNRQEVPDIVDSFVPSTIQRQTSDQLSVLSWIKQWEGSSDLSPILCYKLEGSTDWVDLGLRRDDFMIVVQTELQKEMARIFAKNGICCDSTTIAGASEFALTTLQAVDEFGQVHPIACCLSSSNAKALMNIFFDSVKKSCGDLSPVWFMSDLHDHFHDAWTSVFSSETRRLICPWYVDKAWAEMLKKTVGNMSIESRVYKLLRILLEQTEQKLFEDHLQTLLDRLSVSAKTQEFRRYFLTQWVSRKHQWTYCCNAATATAFVEPFYQTFHYEYSQANISDRLDMCLLHLLKYTRDCLVNRRISLTKGKALCQAADVQARHAASTKMDASSVRTCPDDPHRWEVVADDQVVHTVQESAAVCKQRRCPISCLHCHICIHQYFCNCLDNLLHTTICKHIHLVHTALHSEQGGAPIRDTQWLKDRIQSRVHRLMAVVNSANNEHFSALQELDSKLGVCSSLLDSRLLWGPTNLLQSRHDVPSQGGLSGLARKDKRRSGSVNGAAKKKQKKQDGGEISSVKDGMLNQSVEESVVLQLVSEDTDLHNTGLPVSIQNSATATVAPPLPPQPIHVTSPQQISHQIEHHHATGQQILPVMTSHMAQHQTSQQNAIITYPPSRTIMSTPANHTAPGMHQFASLVPQPIIHTPGGHIPHTNQLGGMQYQQLRAPMPSQLGPGTSQTPMDYHQTVRPVLMGHTDTQQLATMSEEQLTTLAGVAALFGEG